ncbi:hypothetical protein AB4Y36_38175 [Paraburkholderia sp. BR10936]|uniref:hypothetical protein n=1 Tax=Paraburkholderia sp. BR10936 TaxID=3236993 RepID=UPI0034D27B2D
MTRTKVTRLLSGAALERFAIQVASLRNAIGVARAFYRESGNMLARDRDEFWAESRERQRRSLALRERELELLLSTPEGQEFLHHEQALLDARQEAKR